MCYLLISVILLDYKNYVLLNTLLIDPSGAGYH